MFYLFNYSCGLSTATIEYSCPSLCLSSCVSCCVTVCLSVRVSVCVHTNSKNNTSIHLKLEHIVGYENSSEEFDIGHYPIKIKVTEIFLYLPQYKLSSPISQLWHT